MGEVKRCESCGSIVSEREITLYRGLVSALFRVFQWVEEKGVHEFSRKDIKHLFANENDTARFGDWVMFGGLIYKEKKGRYGLNIERVRDFFAGKYRIPIRVWKNPVTGELRPEEYRLIHEIPKLTEFLDNHNEYIARYREPQQEQLIW